MSAKKTLKKLSKSGKDVKKGKVSGKSAAIAKKAKPVVAKAKNAIAKKPTKVAKPKVAAKKQAPKKAIPKKPIKVVKKIVAKKPAPKPVKKATPAKKVAPKKAAPKKVKVVKQLPKKKEVKKPIVKKVEIKKITPKKAEPKKIISKIALPKKELEKPKNNKSTQPVVIEKTVAKKVVETKKPISPPIVKETEKAVIKTKEIKNKNNKVPSEKEETPKPVIRFAEGVKRKIIKDLNTLPQDLLDRFHHNYPEGYEKFVTSFMTIKNELIRVVPMETEEAHYLIKVPVKIAKDTDDDEDDFEAEENDTIGDDGEIESTTEDGEMNFDIADDAD